ncbi:MAG: M20/M25/M40 family metallo-hydrolase [Planctomycetes bacterium]|nr:M20/M25/M40 family metallo-hydrolase [Planctomycetota bacterium]
MNLSVRIFVGLMLIICCSVNVFAQDYKKIVAEVNSSKTVQTVFDEFENQIPQIKTAWKEMARLYSPSGNEALRARYIVGKFKSYGIESARIDSHGNAVGMVEGKTEGPAIVFLGTMDDLATVAEMVKTWDKAIEEKDGRLIGPGTNSSATCATLLGVARLFTLEEVSFAGKVYFVGVVQEETGLTGIKGFLDDHPGEIDYVVDIMSGIGSISYGAIGIHWFKIHFKGNRGHTLSGGLPNVTRAVAQAVDRIFDLTVPKSPADKRSHLNISMLGAGSVFNHKHDDGWFSVDLRSMDNDVLNGLKREIFTIAEEVAAVHGFEYLVENYSEVPAGQIPGARDSDLVRIAEEATLLLGSGASLGNSGSSNMNVGIAHRIPSISTGGSRGSGRNTFDEYANVEPNLTGIKLNFLIGYIITNMKQEYQNE